MRRRARGRTASRRRRVDRARVRNSASGTLRHRLDQFVAEFAADHRADLRDFLGGGPSRSSRAISEACRVARHRERGSGHAPTARRRLRAGTFQHRLGQFLDEQRHAVGALDDLRDDLRRQRRVAGQMPAPARRRRVRRADSAPDCVTCGWPPQGD